MSLHNPSQFDYDKSTRNDFIYIQRRNIVYRIIRELLKNKRKINIKDPITNKTKRIYSEDCTLIFQSDLAYYTQLDNVNCTYSSKFITKYSVPKVLDLHTTELYFNIKFTNNDILSIPIDAINRIFDKRNEQLYKQSQQDKLNESYIYSKYTPDYFKKIIQDKNIDKWVYSYCPICGKCSYMVFKKDDIDIFTDCICNNIKLPIKNMNYKEFSDWYNVQNNTLLKYYKNTWG